MENEVKKVKPIVGIVLFVLVIAMMIYVAAPIQMKLGLYGVAITEVIIALMGIIPIFIFKMKLKEVLPIKKPKFLELVGVGVMWGGSYLLVMISSLVIGYLFPQMSEVNEALTDIFTSVPMGIAFLIIAIMPAICEEILHRGFILSTFKTIRSKWVIVFSMAFIFGLFHLDPYRFLPTAILGGALTYIMIETKNFLLPMLFHMVNNAFSTGAAFLVKNNEDLAEASASQATIPASTIGIFFIMGTVIPFLFLLGSWLLKNASKEKAVTPIKTKNRFLGLWIALATSAVLFITGAVITAMNISDFATVFETDMTSKINADSEDLEMDMEIVMPYTYIMDLTMNNERGISEFIIQDADGNEVFSTSASTLTMDGHQLKLESGNYKIQVKFHLDPADSFYTDQVMSETDLKNLGLDVDPQELSNFEMKVSFKTF